MSSIADNFAEVRARIAAACADAGRSVDDVALLAVSKRHPAASVQAAMAAGQREFGESRVQELLAKSLELEDAAELRWHMIGSVQTNKVRDLVRVRGLALLHSCDRVKLADALQNELDDGERRLDVLLQINATGEEQKHGCGVERADAFLDHVQAACPRLRVCGLMAMGPLQGDPAPVFARVAALRDDLRRRSGLPLSTLSLGMSGDLAPAIAAGSTMVRVGTALFGARS